MPFDYQHSHYPIPDRIPPAHRDAWVQLAKPGMWWTGAERVEIAQETRDAEDCELCATRRDALSAASVAGEHTATTDLPAPAIEAIHKIVTDPGRLSRDWLDGLLATGLTGRELRRNRRRLDNRVVDRRRTPRTRAGPRTAALP